MPSNQWFDVAEGSFYSHLNNIIKSTELNERPQFIGKDKMPSANQESTSKTTTEDFEEFWRPIWEKASEVPIKTEWIKNVESALKQHIRQPSESVRITKEMVTESITNTRNWSSPGKDKNYQLLDKEDENLSSRHLTSAKQNSHKQTRGTDLACNVNKCHGPEKG